MSQDQIMKPLNDEVSVDTAVGLTASFWANREIVVTRLQQLPAKWYASPRAPTDIGAILGR